MSKIHDSFNDNCQIDSIYLDFRKAFDKVSHFKLLLKLSNAGISGNVLKWFHNYLSNRLQLVSINGVHSSVLSVSSGVPQGSVLGPLLFLVFINDLPAMAASSNVYLFADDTKCCQHIKVQSDCSHVQQCIDNLFKWSEKWSLPFNDSKCTLMHFHKSRKPNFNHAYTIGVHTLSCQNKFRDLGVIFQSDLNWANHYDNICSKVLGLLRRSFSLSHSTITKRNCKMYIALVRSQLTYCSQIFWRPALIKDIKKIEQVQRRATKFILGTSYPHR